MANEKNQSEADAYRILPIQRAAADIAERLVAGKFLYRPTYRECLIVLHQVESTIRECMGENEKEEENVSEQNGAEEISEGSV